MSYGQPDVSATFARPDWSALFAGRTKLGGSELTAILSLVGSADTITFSGGFPAPETFPVGLVGPIVSDLLARDPAGTLQYTPTEGLPSSRTAICELVAATQETRPASSDVLVTSGGIEALQLLCRVLVEPGDAVAVEAPSYLGALMAFAGAEATILGASVDAEGLCVDELERRFESARPVPKICYVIPDFQNPTGLSLSLERREALVALCRRYGVLLVEDVAYRELGFTSSPPPPSLWSLDPDSVLQIGTFSKILFPGARLGWAVGPSEVISMMAVAKQNTDQCAGGLGQRIMSAFVEGGHFPSHLVAARALYERRAAAMLDALDRHMPEGTTWTRPQGGFFVWLTAPPGVDATAMASKAQRENVAFVPGAPFYTDGRGINQVRLAYSGVPEDRIVEGVVRLGRVLRNEMGRE